MYLTHSFIVEAWAIDNGVALGLSESRFTVVGAGQAGLTSKPTGGRSAPVFPAQRSW